jgi:hypothetical protein
MASGLPYAGWTATPLNEVGSIGRASVDVQCRSVGGHCPEGLSCFHAPAVMPLQLNRFCTYPRLCYSRHLASERCLIGYDMMTKLSFCQADCGDCPNLFVSGLHPPPNGQTIHHDCHSLSLGFHIAARSTEVDDRGVLGQAFPCCKQSFRLSLILYNIGRSPAAS